MQSVLPPGDSNLAAINNMNTAGIEFVYQWRYDAPYYRAVIDRYYRQLPFLLHLPTQFTLLWILLSAGCWALLDVSLADLTRWAFPVGVLAVPGLVWLTKKAIFLKYRSRPSFGTDACYTLTDSGGRIQQVAGDSRFPWSTFTRAVRFSDGILLLRRGVARWLPDESLVSGSVDDVLTLVKAKLPTRVIP